jgi:RNase P subunit RPR2
MASFAKKVKRRQMVRARKQFMKDFKRSMKKFKKQVVCSSCGRPPYEGENIDNWHINKSSEKIDLICTDCYDGEEDQTSEEF